MYVLLGVKIFCNVNKKIRSEDFLQCEQKMEENKGVKIGRAKSREVESVT